MSRSKNGGTVKSKRYVGACRLCLKKEGLKIGIFSAEGKRRQLGMKIQRCLPLVINENDTYTKLVCHRCIFKVESFCNFQERCIKSIAAHRSKQMNLTKINGMSVTINKDLREAVVKNRNLCPVVVIKKEDICEAQQHEQNSAPARLPTFKTEPQDHDPSEDVSMDTSDWSEPSKPCKMELDRNVTAPVKQEGPANSEPLQAKPELSGNLSGTISQTPNEDSKAAISPDSQLMKNEPPPAAEVPQLPPQLQIKTEPKTETNPNSCKVENPENTVPDPLQLPEDVKNGDVKMYDLNPPNPSRV